MYTARIIVIICDTAFVAVPPYKLLGDDIDDRFDKLLVMNLPECTHLLSNYTRRSSSMPVRQWWLHSARAYTQSIGSRRTTKSVAFILLEKLRGR